MTAVTFSQTAEGVRIDAPDGITAQMYRAFADLCGLTGDEYETKGLPYWDDTRSYEAGSFKK